MRQRDEYSRTTCDSLSHHFYIIGEIHEECGWLVDLLDALDTASVDDIIYIHLNTPGGDLDVAVQIIHSIYQTKGRVITCADGGVSSADSLLLFSGHSFKVGDYCEVMLHDGSYGQRWKFNENLEAARAYSKRLHKLYHNVYGGFFTKREIDKVLKGGDKYLDSDETELRINNYIDSQRKKVEDTK